jgi:hypothetical protein
MNDIKLWSCIGDKLPLMMSMDELMMYIGSTGPILTIGKYL